MKSWQRTKSFTQMQELDLVMLLMNPDYLVSDIDIDR